MVEARKKLTDIVLYAILIIVSIIFLAPVLIVLMNSFKGQFYISAAPFKLPDSETFAGLTNYIISVSVQYDCTFSDGYVFNVENSELYET